MNVKRKLTLAALTATSLGLLFQFTARTSPAQPTDAALIAKARLIHEHVITLDTHNDIEPSNFTPDCNYTMRLTTQVNIPKMVEGQRVPPGCRQVRRRSSPHRKNCEQPGLKLGID